MQCRFWVDRQHKNRVKTKSHLTHDGSPESDKPLKYLSPVFPNQRILAIAGLARNRTLHVITLITRAGLSPQNSTGRSM